MSSPRVIFVNRVYWPSEAATAQLLTDLCEGLAASGWEVLAIAAGDHTGPQRGVQIHRAGCGDRHRGMISRVVNYLGFTRAARNRLNELVQPGDIVVLMTDPPLLAPCLAGFVRKRGAQLVHWIQDIYPEIAMLHAGVWSRPVLTPWRIRRDWAWRNSDRCVVVGNDMRLTLEAAGAGAHTLCCPNWAPQELEQPADSAKVAALRREWGMADKFLAVYSGNLGRVHEFETILGAAAQMKQDRDLLFVFIGEGARYQEVRRSAQQRGLTNVYFLPPQPRMRLRSALAAADVHFVTQLPGYECLVNPSKLAGVLAAGRPAIWIGPTASANAGLLERTGSGIAVATGDYELLARTLAHWKADPSELQQRGLSARLCYRDHFTFPAALQFWQMLLRALADSGSLQT